MNKLSDLCFLPSKPSYDLKPKNLMSLFSVSTRKAVFISNVDSIKTIDDLKPGMLVDATIKNIDATVDLISPSIPIMTKITRIETDGKMDDTLFQAGIDDLNTYGFDYENGRIHSKYKVDESYLFKKQT